LESLAAPLTLCLPTRGHDLPRNMFTATKSRLDTNWDLLHAYFGELRLKDWKPLNSTTAFFQSEEIMSDPRCM